MITLTKAAWWIKTNRDNEIRDILYTQSTGLRDKIKNPAHKFFLSGEKMFMYHANLDRL